MPFVGSSTTLGETTTWRTNSRPIICAETARIWCTFLTMRRVQLHSPSHGFRLRGGMFGMPCLMMTKWGGGLEVLNFPNIQVGQRPQPLCQHYERARDASSALRSNTTSAPLVAPCFLFFLKNGTENNVVLTLASGTSHCSVNRSFVLEQNIRSHGAPHSSP